LKKFNIIDPNETFDGFVKNKFRHFGVEYNEHFHKQYIRAYCKENKFVDFVGKLETINEDWKYISSIIKCQNELPHKNTTPHKDYREYYDEDSKRIISDIYSKDIELFDYKF